LPKTRPGHIVYSLEKAAICCQHAAIARMGDGARAAAAGFEPDGAQSRPFQNPNRRNRPRPVDPSR
jgi:hypothetical protein